MTRFSTFPFGTHMISTLVEDTAHLSADIAIIGGSGLYQMQALSNKRQIKISTPFGKPSDDIVMGEMGDVTVAFLTRHGQGHKLINYQYKYLQYLKL